MKRLAALLAFAPLVAAAQTYKCTDPRGAVTYSNESCEKQGLKDAGKVRERLTTMKSDLPVRKLSPKKEPEKEPGKKEAEKKETEKGPAR